MKNIDELHSNKVFQDEIKKVQEQYLKQLIDVRAKAAVAIQKACEIAASGGGAGGGSVVPKADYDQLQAENNKLKYRITHLLKALGEKDEAGGSSVQGGLLKGGDAKGGSLQKMYITSEGSSSSHMNMIQVLCQLLGKKF